MVETSGHELSGQISGQPCDAVLSSRSEDNQYVTEVGTCQNAEGILTSVKFPKGI